MKYQYQLFLRSATWEWIPIDISQHPASTNLRELWRHVIHLGEHDQINGVAVIYFQGAEAVKLNTSLGDRLKKDLAYWKEQLT